MTDIMGRFDEKWIPEPNSGCWLWFGAIACSDGYGAINVSRKSTLAHRFSYSRFVGPIPKGMQVLHRCDMPCCVNPDHLFLGTHIDNMEDMTRKGRRKAKLTRDLVRHIRTSLKTGQDLAKELGVSESTISMARNGITWKTV